MNGKEGITDLVRGGMILSALHEKDAELFEKGRCVSVKPRHLFNHTLRESLGRADCVEKGT
mgnify:CR=1 FL=1